MMQVFLIICMVIATLLQAVTAVLSYQAFSRYGKTWAWAFVTVAVTLDTLRRITSLYMACWPASAVVTWLDYALIPLYVSCTQLLLVRALTAEKKP